MEWVRAAKIRYWAGKVDERRSCFIRAEDDISAYLLSQRPKLALFATADADTG